MTYTNEELLTSAREYTLNALLNITAMRGELGTLKRGLVDHFQIVLATIDGELASMAAVQPKPSITCPVCGMTSHHPTDVETGYCGNCHGYTSAVDPLETAKRFLRESGYGG